ncbi:hypothetical protein V6N00_12675 [Tersicoccus sp. MR15.9]|uniref:hypothetical protein n=1 Tax=Tersicoccus mangrovi TaxID=3121635 RepID=UPI002FE52509
MATDQLTAFLTDRLAVQGVNSFVIEHLVADLREQFDIREKVVVPKEAPAPALGQVWRNKTSDRLVRIIVLPGQFILTEDGRSIRTDSVHWEALTGRGPKTGKVYAQNWDSRFEFVSDAA